jgi:hypothetical protein
MPGILKKYLLVGIFATLLSFQCCEALTKWSGAVQISNTPSSIQSPPSPPLAVDSHSNAVVGWLNSTSFPGGNEILSSVLPFGASHWNSSQIILELNPPNFPTNPLIFIDKFEHQFVLFGALNANTLEFVLNASKRPTGVSSWSLPIVNPINGLPNNGNGDTGILGDVVAFLPINTATNPNFFEYIFTSLSHGAKEWGPLTILGTITTPSQQDAQASCAITKNQAILVWTELGPVIKSSRYNVANQQFHAINDFVLPPSTGSLQNIFLAIDARGDAVLFFSLSFSSDPQTTYCSTLSADGTDWTPLQQVSTPGTNSLAFDLKMDKAGNSVLLWAEQQADIVVRAADLPLNGTITNISNLSTPSSSVFMFGSLGVDAFGNAVAAWADVQVTGDLVQVAAKPAGGIWSDAQTLSTTGTNPRVVLSDQETAVAIWLDVNSNFLMGSSNPHLFYLEPPTHFVGKTGTNNFLFQSEQVLNVRWQPSPAPNITNYIIHKDGQLVANIPGKGPFEMSFPIGVKGIYTLTAVASNGNKSLPIPLIVK